MSYETFAEAMQIVSRMSADNYQEIADAARELAQATFCMFSVYEDSSEVFKTVAVSGSSEQIIGVSGMLGFELVGREWYHDYYRDHKVAGASRTEYADFIDFARDTLPNNISPAAIAHQFHLGKVIVMNLRQGTHLLGGLTLFMPIGLEVQNPNLVDTFTLMVGSMLDRMRTNTQLRQSKEQLQSIFNNAGVGISLLTLDSKYMKVNKRYCEITGYSEDELLSLYCRDISDPNGLKRDRALGTKALLQRLLRTGEPYMRVKAYVHKQGHLIWVETSTALLRGQNGTPDMLIRMSQDITEQQQAREALRISEAKNAKMIANIGDVIVIIDKDGINKYKSASIEKLFGWKPEELVGLSTWGNVHPDDVEAAQAFLGTIMGVPNTTGTTECRYRCKDGSYKWIEISVANLLDDPEIRGVLGNYHDITERKHIEKMLRESEDKYRQITDNISDVVWIADLNLTTTYLSPSAERLFGYPLDTYINLSQEKRFTKDSLAKINSVLLEELAKENLADSNKDRTRLFDVELYRADGSTVCVALHASILRDNSGNAVKIQSVLRDITKQRKLEQAIYNEKEQFKTTLLSVGDGVISTDSRGNVLLINKVAEQLTGWTQDEAFGRPLEGIFHIINEFTREECESPVHKVFATGETVELDKHTILVSRDNIERPIEDGAAPIKDEKGNITGVVLVFRDFTEKKQRLAEIERLSFRDPLTGLYNRRFFEEELKRLDTGRNMPLTLIMLDVNGLKLVNDAFGHQLGDKVLQRVAETVKKECRADDIIARIGGDEFVMILPKTKSVDAGLLIERIHSAIDNETVGSLKLSVSCGWDSKLEISQDIKGTLKKAEDHMYRNKLSERSSMRHKTIEVILRTFYEKSAREEHHSGRVSELCAALGIALQLSHEQISELRTVGLMHDIGKIAIDDSILNKAEPLDDSEWAEIRRHSEIGYQILSSAHEFASLAEHVLAHHERWDGTGYPRNLRGEDIPLIARIIAVADAYDTITVTARPHRHALSKAEAMEEIQKHSGTQFDPHIAKTFIERVLKKDLV